MLSLFWSSWMISFSRTMVVGNLSYHNTVIPGEKGKFVQASDKIPACSNVTSNENATSK